MRGDVATAPVESAGAPVTRRLLLVLGPIVSGATIAVGVVLVRGGYWSSGILCLMIGPAAAVETLRRLSRAPLDAEERRRLRRPLAYAVGWAAVAALQVWPGLLAWSGALAPARGRAAAVSWIGSLLLGLLLVWGASCRNGVGLGLAALRRHRREAMAVAAIAAVALLLRTLWLPSHPYPWSGDEASVAMAAAAVRSGDVTNLFAAGWSNQPWWSFVPATAFEFAVGYDILAVRLPSALAGTLAVLATYLLGRVLFGTGAALFAAAFLASLPYHVHFSRLGVQNINDSLLSALVLGLLAIAVARNDFRVYYTAGAVSGLCLYTYPGARLVPLFAGAVMVALSLRQRGYARAQGAGIAAFAVGGLVSATPQAIFFLRHPDIFMGRLAQEGIFLIGWLWERIAATGDSLWQVLWQQLVRTVAVFIAAPAASNFFNSPEPYLTTVGAVLALLGIALALYGSYGVAGRGLIVWIGIVVVLGGVLTLSPPSHTRLLMVTPPLALLTALGAQTVVLYIRALGVTSPKAGGTALTTLALLLAWQHVTFYMGEYRRQMYFADANSEYAMEAGLVARKLGAGVELFVIGAPRVFASFPTLAFAAPAGRWHDLPPGAVDRVQLPPGTPVAFFAIPENRHVLQHLAGRFPGGTSAIVFRKTVTGEPLFENYLVTARERGLPGSAITPLESPETVASSIDR